MRVLFAGTPGIAVPSLRQVASRHRLVAVLTGEDQQVGRGRHSEPSAVKRAALELGIPVIEADRLSQAVRDRVAADSPEILAVVAFGRIFRERFLALFPRGGVNLHPSLLPRHRGPSPISAAILAGDAETGVSVQGIALAVDAGPVYAQRRVPLDGTETTGTLTDTLAAIGAELLAETLDAIEAGTASAEPQEEAMASSTRLLAREDGLVDWGAPAAAVERQVRACDPWPRAYTSWEGRQLLVLHSRLLAGTVERTTTRAPGTVLGPSPEGLLVQAGDGPLAIQRLQLATRKPMDWRSFLNGYPGVVGARLGGG